MRESSVTVSMYLITTIIALTQPVHSVMIATGVLLVFDFTTGVWAAHKQGIKITSAGFKKSLWKMLGYQLTIVTALVMEHHLMQGTPVVNVVAGAIGLTEGFSVLENIKKITGVDIMALLRDKIKGSSSKNDGDNDTISR